MIKALGHSLMDTSDRSRSRAQRDQSELLGRPEAARRRRGPGGCILSGQQHAAVEEYRSARRGQYRVVHSLHDEEVLVRVVRPSHRADVYR
jgi:mRNA-degrading endonuclease RelE of RelBE toxin-antitoxin system